MKKQINSLLFISFTVVFICITVLSLLPPKHVEIGEHDKLGHFMAYGTLMINFGLWQKNIRIQQIGFFIFLCYGCLIEYIQGFVPGREPSMHDIMANSAGLVCGFILLMGIHRFRKN